MKVAARMTAATSALVAGILGVYVLFDLRSAAVERRVAMEREARDLTATVRAILEARGIEEALGEGPALAAEIRRARTPWAVEILPASLARRPAPPGRRAQVRRLSALVEFRHSAIVEESGDHIVYATPLRVSSLTAPDDYEVAGSVEVSRSTAYLRSELRADLAAKLPAVILGVALTILAVALLTRSLVTQPIQKLLLGMDEVSRGDLSHVLLPQRDDEIGELATRFTQMTGSLRDSRAETERQNQAKMQLEERLANTEKLATMGQLAAEIAHEVGTPLNVIAGRAKNLARKAHEPAAISKNATIIAEQTERIARIIQRLLDFTRRALGSQGEELVNLNELTLVIMDFLESKFSAANIRTTLERWEGLPPVRGEPDRLQQVLLNLVLNAIQAMPEGGLLRVETSITTRQRPGLEAAPAQDYVVLHITDSGTGIPPAYRNKIFEPFYTSRESEGGTGLGLSVCYGIVKEHDGWMEIADASERGTVVRVFLPAAMAGRSAVHSCSPPRT